MATRPNYQRRHYRQVAEIIRAARSRNKSCETAALLLDEIEGEFATLFRSDNANFSAPKFYAAADPLYPNGGA